MIACRPRLAQVSIIALIAVVNCAGLYGYYFRWRTEDWQTAVLTVTGAMLTQDIVLVACPVNEIGNIIGYYAPQLPNKLTFIGDAAAVDRVTDATSGHRVWQISTMWHDQVSRTSIARALARDHTILRSIAVNLVDVTLWGPRS